MIKRFKAYLRLKKRNTLASRLEEIEHLFFCRASNIAGLTIEKLDIEAKRRGRVSNRVSRNLVPSV